jgi:hypothetical protein
MAHNQKLITSINPRMVSSDVLCSSCIVEKVVTEASGRGRSSAQVIALRKIYLENCHLKTQFRTFRSKRMHLMLYMDR